MGLFTNRPLLAAMIIILVIFGVFVLRVNQENFDYVYTDTTPNQDSSSSSSIVVNSNSSTNTIDNSTSTGISLSELSKHNNDNDCWIVYKGKVYDVTSYLPRHPGGVSRIGNTCGDSNLFEERFTRQHGTSKVSLLMKVGTFIGDFDVMGSLA